jgi:hypothetical protein
MSTQAPGYSGTPLVRKLGVKEGARVFLVGAPVEYTELLEPLPAGVSFTDRLAADTDMAHVFATARNDLVRHLALLRKVLRPDAMVWVSWPKKASRVPTDITEDSIREVALPLGFVDVKVCAVTEVWSGLKLVVRKELR